MSFIRNRIVGVRQPTPTVQQDPPYGGPVVTVESGPTQDNNVRSVPAPRSRLERIGFWIIVAAAVAVLLLLLGVLLPPIMGGLVTGFYTGLFAATLTLLNTQRASGWANAVLGRQVFPVLRAPHGDIWRLALVNGGLMFTFAFLFHVLAHFIGPFFTGFLVFAALVGAGVFYSRARKVIIKP